LSLTAVEFNKLVELACERDETACRDLGRMSQQLAPHLPETRGRPISDYTCIHLFLLRQLESWGNKCAYTSSKDNAGFMDPVTRATQLASGNGGFSPLYANRLHKESFCLRFFVCGPIEGRAPRRRGACAIAIEAAEIFGPFCIFGDSCVLRHACFVFNS
jgi:hypothetical protein